MWERVISQVDAGQRLLTPGRGIPPSNQKPFFIVEVHPDYLKIEIGSSRTPNTLPRAMFDAVEQFFIENPQGYLRAAAEHQKVPTSNSVDEVVRSAVHFYRAIGNYVAAILEAAGCVRYSMVADRKVISVSMTVKP